MVELNRVSCLWIIAFQLLYTDVTSFTKADFYCIWSFCCSCFFIQPCTSQLQPYMLAYFYMIDRAVTHAYIEGRFDSTVLWFPRCLSWQLRVSNIHTFMGLISFKHIHLQWWMVSEQSDSTSILDISLHLQWNRNRKTESGDSKFTVSFLFSPRSLAPRS